MKTVELGRKTSQPFSTSTFEYENENEYGKAGHEHEYELTECRTRINSSELMSNTVDIRNLIRNTIPQFINLNKCMTKLTKAWCSSSAYEINEQIQV
jgi:hypothetical protein